MKNISRIKKRKVVQAVRRKLVNVLSCHCYDHDDEEMTFAIRMHGIGSLFVLF